MVGTHYQATASLTVYSVAQPLERGSNHYYSIIQGGYKFNVVNF